MKYSRISYNFSAKIQICLKSKVLSQLNFWTLWTKKDSFPQCGSKFHSLYFAYASSQKRDTAFGGAALETRLE